MRILNRVLFCSVILGLLAIMSGCIPPQAGFGARTMLKLTVEWDKLDTLAETTENRNNLLPSGASVGGGLFSKVGVRLAHLDYEAAFSRAITRQTAEESGTITFRVPPGKADLFIVAVSQNTAQWFGVRRHLQIPEEGTISLTSDDLSWYEATWENLSPYPLSTSGTTQAPDGSESLEVPLRVRDPFQVGQNPDWGDMLLKVEGIASSQGYNNDGWRYFKAYLRKSDSGYIQPYVAGEMFNLGSYLPVPSIVGQVLVQWQ